MERLTNIGTKGEIWISDNDETRKIGKKEAAYAKLKEYEDIGKVSTCRNAVELCRAMIERGIEPDNIKEYIKFEDNLVQRGYDLKRFLEMMEEHKQYREIGTPEECRAAVEKQTAKKVEIWNDGSEHCPCCDKNNSYLGFKVCIECGQLLDWNEET